MISWMNDFYLSATNPQPVKWTAPHSRIGLSKNKSDVKLYAIFEFCQVKNHKHLIEYILIYKAKLFMLTKKI